MCQGYYDHEKPYLPEWPSMSRYQGLLVYAQLWDPKTDYAGKRVLVIGSGATAATVVPAFCEKAEHVAMLQRSPTYFYCHANVNELADRLRQIGIDAPAIHRVVRAQVLYDQQMMTERCLKEPDGDVFQAAAKGKLTVVTDIIETFTETGVRTASGQEIAADIIVVATGFRLSVMGDIPFFVDDTRVDRHQTVNYRGMMFTGVPNLVWVFGYFRASWTLRVDLLGDFVTKLLNHTDAKGVKRVDVALRDEDRDMALRLWIERENFNSGYLVRGIDQLPLREQAGHVWTWTAIDANTKLIMSYMVGDRDTDTAMYFMHDLRERCEGRMQLTTDGYKPYLNAVETAFQDDDVDYAQLVKLYGNEPGKTSDKKYSPGVCMGAIKSPVTGKPDNAHISTSYVERSNLTMRMSMRRFTRLTNAFSKKIDNHIHMISLYTVWYNFIRIHKTLKTSPAMAAGISKTLWSMDDIVTLIDARAKQPKRPKACKKAAES